MSKPTASMCCMFRLLLQNMRFAGRRAELHGESFGEFTGGTLGRVGVL
jgi:hypothetical protein